MKVTIDLPDQVVKRVKLRAVHDGRKLKDTVEELLLKGLTASAGSVAVKNIKKGRLEIDRKTGLPVFRPAPGMQPARRSMEEELEFQKKVLEAEDLARAGLFIGR